MRMKDEYKHRIASEIYTIGKCLGIGFLLALIPFAIGVYLDFTGSNSKDFFYCLSLYVVLPLPLFGVYFSRLCKQIYKGYKWVLKWK